MMNPCIVIPTCNNGTTLPDMLARMAPLGYPIIIVDDGSSAPSATAVKAAADRWDNVQLLVRATNGGKGAAVMDGIEAAFERGFSHALQIDGDNQHRVEDIPLFLEAARQHPSALVLGSPVFPPDTPKARLIGRRISIVWVAIETLSRSIADPLFGLRVYPVAITREVIRRARPGRRMDFDPEIAVRLYWEGLDVVNIPAPVTYHEGGVSSFRMLRDNVRISWMHTRLFIGMIGRIWKLLLRRRSK